MSLGRTKIPYLTRLWHPTTGCSRGCQDCWASDLVCNRLAGTMKGLQTEDPFAPTFHLDRLADPLRTKKPQIIGVSFLGDLFDLAIANEQIATVFGVMEACPRHTFIVLTKQSGRMREWFGWMNGTDLGWEEKEWRKEEYQGSKKAMLAALYAEDYLELRNEQDHRWWKALNSAWLNDVWPLLNVWLGVSVADQTDADSRIPDLLQCPATHRWVSYEPATGEVNLRNYLVPKNFPKRVVVPFSVPVRYMPIAGLDAVIMGGLHDPKATMRIEWARSMRDQCAEAEVPFALKQFAGAHPIQWPDLDGVKHVDVPWMKEGEASR